MIYNFIKNFQKFRFVVPHEFELFFEFLKLFLVLKNYDLNDNAMKKEVDVKRDRLESVHACMHRRMLDVSYLHYSRACQESYI